MRKIAILCASAAVLVAPSSALAKNIKHEGQIVGDKATSVKLRVKVNGGKAKKVGGFKAKNVMVRCDKGPARINFTALTPVNVNSSNVFKVRLSDGDGGILRISGKVKKNGKATVGNLKTNNFKSETDSGKKQSCKAPKQKFKTSNK